VASLQAAPEDHPYLKAKDIRPSGLRLLKDRLAVPLYDADDALRDILLIGDDGTASYQSGAATVPPGSFYRTGPIDNARLLLLCVDIKTADVIAEAMGATAVAAITSENLLEIARALRRRSSKLKLIVCGDDDWKAPDKPAANAAEWAARAADAELAFPVFAPGYARSDDETSFYDLYEAEDAGRVRELIEAAKSLDVIEAQGGFDEPRNQAILDQIDAAVARLAALPEAVFQQVRKKEAERLKVAPGWLERQVKAERRRQDEAAAKAAASAAVPVVEPRSEKVDGDELLTALVGAVQKSVILFDAKAIEAALWAVFAHAHNEFRVSPYLAIASPTPECGKTRLLTVISGLVPNPLAGSSLTAATIYHSESTPTLLADELHGWLHKDKELRAILNSGHDREFAYVLRTVSAGNGKRRTERFSTWMPKVLAGIGGLPNELASRSIHIRLEKKLPGEETQDPNPQELHNLHRMVVRWVADRRGYFSKVDPEMPASLHSRARDNWKPLLAIAELAGGKRKRSRDGNQGNERGRRFENSVARQLPESV
jgi:putative DNA primase/helicase